MAAAELPRARTLSENVEPMPRSRRKRQLLEAVDLAATAAAVAVAVVLAISIPPVTPEYQKAIAEAAMAAGREDLHPLAPMAQMDLPFCIMVKF